MLFTSALCTIQNTETKKLSQRVQKNLFVSFKNFLSERSLITLEMKLHIFAPEYLIDCCIPFFFFVK